jgi:hypothetical protein
MPLVWPEEPHQAHWCAAYEVRGFCPDPEWVGVQSEDRGSFRRISAGATRICHPYG